MYHPYISEHCLSGFRGALRDANTRVPDLEGDKSGNGEPCPEDEEFFDARPDAATMEEAIGKFMDGINCRWTAAELIMEDSIPDGRKGKVEF